MNISRFVVCLPLLALLPDAGAQTRVYCCTDASGRQACGDTLPQICYDKAYREVTTGGRVLREVDPPMTIEQRAKRDAALKAERDRAIAEAEAKRRDRVLVDSYASVAEIDARRDRELAGLDIEIRSARQREAELMSERARLEQQKKANSKQAKELEEDLVVKASELAAIRSVLDSKLRDATQIRTRFEFDRRRYLELTAPLQLPRR